MGGPYHNYNTFLNLAPTVPMRQYRYSLILLMFTFSFVQIYFIRFKYHKRYMHFFTTI